MSKESSLDIFSVLKQIDKKNFNLWNEWTDEQKKDFSPYIILRWLAGTNNPDQLTKLGLIATSTIFEFGSKKDLMLAILTACSSDGPKQYKWLTYKGSEKTQPGAIKLISEVYNLSIKDAGKSLNLFSNEEILELAEYNGLQPDEIKSLKKEL